MPALSKPIEYYEQTLVVRWQGWESSTWRLKQCGWSIRAKMETSDYGRTKTLYLSLAPKHKGFVLIGAQELKRLELMTKHGHPPHIELMGFKASDYCQVHVPPVHGQKAFIMSMDAEPWDGLLRYEETRYQFFELPVLHDENDSKAIILPHEAVDQALDTILKLQDPKRKEIKEATKLEAQIYAG